VRASHGHLCYTVGTAIKSRVAARARVAGRSGSVIVGGSKYFDSGIDRQLPEVPARTPRGLMTLLAC
jgi:hypothetical protein